MDVIVVVLDYKRMPTKQVVNSVLLDLIPQRDVANSVPKERSLRHQEPPPVSLVVVDMDPMQPVRIVNYALQDHSLLMMVHVDYVLEGLLPHAMVHVSVNHVWQVVNPIAIKHNVHCVYQDNILHPVDSVKTVLWVPTVPWREPLHVFLVDVEVKPMPIGRPALSVP